MKKRDILRRMGKLNAFRKVQSFYIGICNDDIISGYCLDMSPQNVYIWRFVIPSYDNISFLHLSLGFRILHIPLLPQSEDHKADFENEILRDWSQFSKIDNRKSLIFYINDQTFAGIYPSWVRYITHIIEREFAEADRMTEEQGVEGEFSELKLISESYSLIKEAKMKLGWDAVWNIVRLWRDASIKCYCLK